MAIAAAVNPTAAACPSDAQFGLPASSGGTRESLHKSINSVVRLPVNVQAFVEARIDNRNARTERSMRQLRCSSLCAGALWTQMHGSWAVLLAPLA